MSNKTDVALTYTQLILIEEALTALKSDRDVMEVLDLISVAIAKLSQKIVLTARGIT